jgi:hypothetical protein
LEGVFLDMLFLLECGDRHDERIARNQIKRDRPQKGGYGGARSPLE